MIELWIQQKNIFALLSAVIFITVLTAAAVCDLRTGKILNRYGAEILFLSLASVFIEGNISILSRCIGGVCISVPMLLLACLYPGAFGGGDIKFMAACGTFLGWKNILVAMGVAILTGGAVCAALLMAKKKSRKDRIIFGPFLCIGLLSALLYGDKLWTWIVISG